MLTDYIRSLKTKPTALTISKLTLTSDKYLGVRIRRCANLAKVLGNFVVRVLIDDGGCECSKIYASHLSIMLSQAPPVNPN